jgi:Tfp pilus assembly protein PilN
MRAVNLVPKDARRSRGGATGSSRTPFGVNSLGAPHAVVAVLVIVIALIALRVLADNDVKNKQATLAAVNGQVATEQAEASRLSVYTSFVQAAQAREEQVREIAEQRFPWERSLDQLSRVMPATTSLSSLSASTAGSTSATTGTVGTGPTFNLSGCAATPNQNGVATLLRRLRALNGVTNVGFQSSTRGSCGGTSGNTFGLVLSFAAAGVAATSPSANGTTSAVAQTSTSATAATTPSPTTSGAAAG